MKVTDVMLTMYDIKIMIAIKKMERKIIMMCRLIHIS